MVLSQKWYDALKWVALVALPASSAFYYALAIVWGLPYAGQVVATVAAVDALLGTLLGIGSAKYKNSDERFDGNLNVIKQDASLINQLEIKTDPATLAKQNELVLKVNKVDVPLDSPPRS